MNIKIELTEEETHKTREAIDLLISIGVDAMVSTKTVIDALSNSKLDSALKQLSGKTQDQMNVLGNHLEKTLKNVLAMSMSAGVKAGMDFEQLNAVTLGCLLSEAAMGCLLMCEKTDDARDMMDKLSKISFAETIDMADEFKKSLEETDAAEKGQAGATLH